MCVAPSLSSRLAYAVSPLADWLSDVVLQILISSGAHISRYLIQVAMHHFFHTQSHFIKTSWVRSVPLTVFTHFLKLASERYGDIPRGKSEDDGSILASFLKESRFPSHLRRISWETIRDILETYHVCTCHLFRRSSLLLHLRNDWLTDRMRCDLVYPFLSEGK
jgi:hypothetical protein